MFDHFLSMPQGITTYINYFAILLFIAETIMIAIMKITKKKPRIGFRYLDFFLSKNIAVILLSRAAILGASLAIFTTDGYIYNRLSAIYYIYLPFFVVSCGWIYVSLKGYTEHGKSGDMPS